MSGMSNMMKLCGHLPEVEFAAGEAVVREGGKSGSIWVLVSGALQARKGTVVVNTVTEPGATVGEISVLLVGVAQDHHPHNELMPVPSPVAAC